MTKLTRYFPVLLGFGVFGCSTPSQPSTFEQAAGEVNESFAALTASDPDATFEALDQVSSGSEAVASDDSADAGSDDSASTTVEPSGKREGRGERPHGRGHGLGLLVWYADLDALKVCRDLRDTCSTSADASACEEQVKACVRPVLEQAFKAMCDEQIAACDASANAEKSCESIRSTCGGGLGDQVGDGSVSRDDESKQDDSAEVADDHGGEQKAGKPEDSSGEHHEAEAESGSDDAQSGAKDAAEAGDSHEAAESESADAREHERGGESEDPSNAG